MNKSRNHWRCGIRLAVWFCLSVPAVWAQEPRRFAFLVAVTDYSHANLSPLSYTERDIQAFEAQLRRAGFEVLTLSPQAGGKDPALLPTADNIRRRLSAFLEERRVNRNDLALVGLSGHGLQPRGSGDSYFCPADANPAMQDVEAGQRQQPRFPKTLVSVGELLTDLSDSGVGHKLVLIDACRDAPKSKGGVRSAGIDRVNLSELPSQTAVLLSCSRGEFSFENERFDGGHGAFFSKVIEGMNGRAIDEESQVTWDSLAGYVRKRVPNVVVEVYGKEGGRQRPNLISNVEGEPVVLLTAEQVRALNSKPRPQSPTSPSDPPARPVAGLEGKKAGDERSDNGLGMKLVWCPAGTFTMGCPKSEAGRYDDEDQVQVTLTAGFWLGKYEVTQGEWERVMGTTPWKGKEYVKEGPRYAASYISWDDAMAFVKKLTAQERQAGRLPAGWEYTLPTEAQWEYACRAGTKTAFSFGDTETQLSDYAWWGGLIGNGNAEKEQYAHEVGGKKPNAWGLHDLHGNVFEWCADGYSEKLPGGRDPLTAQASHRVVRGGGWGNSFPSPCRSAFRDRDSPDLRYGNLGFRVARSPVR